MKFVREFLLYFLFIFPILKVQIKYQISLFWERLLECERVAQNSLEQQITDAVKIKTCKTQILNRKTGFRVGLEPK